MRIFLAIAAFAGFCAVAGAQVRTIPEDAKRAQMRHVQDMLIELDGAPQRLAPGAQIRDASNRVILPTAIPEGVQVKYRLDAAGQVRQVWILTPEEAAKP
ncbi:MAG TPA: hypothetical protein VEL04_09540 [Burkholderiales bacterium]|nr:hypothetical protein [Burkholderiales bacterium]